MSDERLVSRAELAELLGVKVRTVDNLVREGLPSVKVGSRRRFRYQEVLQYLVGLRENRAAGRAQDGVGRPCVEHSPGP